MSRGIQLSPPAQARLDDYLGQVERALSSRTRDHTEIGLVLDSVRDQIFENCKTGQEVSLSQVESALGRLAAPESYAETLTSMGAAPVAGFAPATGVMDPSTQTQSTTAPAPAAAQGSLALGLFSAVAAIGGSLFAVFLPIILQIVGSTSTGEDEGGFVLILACALGITTGWLSRSTVPGKIGLVTGLILSVLLAIVLISGGAN